MKYEIEVPSYSAEQGLKFEWDYGFTIKCDVEKNVVVLKANKAGLISIARHLLELAQEDVPLGSHIHLDDMNSLEDGSCELIIGKLEETK